MLTCAFEDGVAAKLRHVTVDALVLDTTGTQVLLVKRAASLLEGGKWGDIGGYMERDETLVGCLEREVYEETGYRVRNAQLLTIRDNPDRPAEDRQNIAFVFFCTAVEKTGTPDAESDEQRWFALHALPRSQELAFDHEKNLKLYRMYQEKHLPLPILNELDALK